MTTKARVAFHNTVIGRDLRLLRRAIARVPSGSLLGTNVVQGLKWDGNTGLFLRPKVG